MIFLFKQVKISASIWVFGNVFLPSKPLSWWEFSALKHRTCRPQHTLAPNPPKGKEFLHKLLVIRVWGMFQGYVVEFLDIVKPDHLTSSFQESFRILWRSYLRLTAENCVVHGCQPNGGEHNKFLKPPSYPKNYHGWTLNCKTNIITFDVQRFTNLSGQGSCFGSQAIFKNPTNPWHLG